MSARIEKLENKSKKPKEDDRLEQLRREYEQRLADADRRLQSVIEMSSDFLWELDTDYRMTTVQGPDSPNLGFDLRSLIGKAHWELPTAVPVSDGASWDKLKAALHAREPFNGFVYKYVTFHAELRYVSITGRPMFDPDGRFAGYRGITKGITQRMQVERRMAVEQQVAHIVSEATTVTDATQRILRAICETLGWACGAYWMLDSETQTLKSTETWGTDAPGVEEFLAVTRNMEPLPITGDGLARRTCASGEPQWIRNVSKDPSFLRLPHAAKAGLRSAFAFPIKVGAKVIGAMEFYSREMAHAADQTLLEGVAHLGASIGQFFDRKRVKQELLRFRAAMDMSADEIYLTDPETLRFVDVNESACRVTGYTREEMLKIGPAQLWAGKLIDFHQLFQDVIAKGPEGTLTEGIGTSKDGRRRCPVEARRRAIWIDNRWIIATVTRDISERKAAEQARQRLNHMYAALSATNEAILRAESPEDLYQRVCEAAVDGGKFHSASVVVPGSEGRSAKTAATAGTHTEWLRDTTISFDDAIAEGRGLIGTAFRSKSVAVSNDYLADERTQPWHAHARDAGIAAAAAAPLMHKGNPAGVLMFFSSEKDAFDDEVRKLIARMAENIAFALENFEHERERRRTEEDLKNFRSVIDTAPDLIFFLDPEEMRFLYWNEANMRVGGWKHDDYKTVTPSQASGVPEAELRRIYNDVIAKQGESVTSEILYKSKSGLPGWFETQRRAVRFGDKWMIVTVSREITGRKLAEKKASWLSRMYAALGSTNEAIMHARTAQELYQRVCEAGVHGGQFHTTAVLVPAPDGQMKVAAVLGTAEKSLYGAKISIDETVPEGNGLVGTAFRTGKAIVSNDFMKDERMRPWHAQAEIDGVKSAAAVPLLHAGRTIGVLLLFSGSKRAFDDEVVKLLERMAENIAFALDNFDHEAERKRAEERIQYLATHDGLTGLPNRVMFSQLLTTTIETARRYERKFAVLFIDLDRFKVINDTLGHEAGDQLLQEVANRLRDALRASDTIARLGGDEFVVLVQEVADGEQAAAVARKVLSTIIRPTVLNGHECRVTASIGIAVYPGDGDYEQALMKHADIAMYHAKEEGKNNFQFHSAKLKSQSLERLALETNLRRALDQNEFSLNYQAKLDLKSGRITGVEALLRWNNPDLGNISPAQFIPLAEETGLIVPIGKWVMRTACMQNVEWQRQGLPAVCMAVNLSARQFSDENLLADIAGALKDSGMAPELLELEITEGMVIHNPERAVEILTAIKQMGVRLAIDDFGTGYSSLGQLKNFPIDTLKVDRSFIREIPTDAEDKAITEAIIAMGKTLSLTVVAEGVETEAQANFLREHACDEMQGYYFSKPVPAEQFARLLGQHASLASK